MDNELLTAKLELIRQEQKAGFEKLEAALDAHVGEAIKVAEQVNELETRLRTIELEVAKSQVKMQLIMTLIGLSSGGVGAFLSKIF